MAPGLFHVVQPTRRYAAAEPSPALHPAADGRPGSGAGGLLLNLRHQLPAVQVLYGRAAADDGVVPGCEPTDPVRAAYSGSGESASASTKARAAVASGVSIQSPTMRITSFRLVTEKCWFSPAPNTAEVTVCVVDRGQCRPMAPTKSITALKIWATEPRSGSILVILWP